MNKTVEYRKTKLALGTAALTVGVPALVFAVFLWSQPAHLFFGGFSRYMFALGGLGAAVSGSMMLYENIRLKALTAKPVKEPALEFLILPHREEEQAVST